MPLSLFESVLGGIGLFLLGMRFMSDGIRTVADDRIRNVFAAFTSNRSYAMLFGLTLSMALNSANAAAIFVIGLANAGILNLYQALSVLAGVLIGASLTLHLPWIPYSLLATPLLFIGVILKYFVRRRRLANVGNFLLGSGLLFLGLSLLETCFRSSVSQPFYSAFNGAFFTHPLLSMIFGGMLAFFVQSTLSSASAVCSLVTSHNINALTASTMMLGGIAGVAVICGLASIGGTSVARRIAASFFMITLCAILPLVAFAPQFLDMVDAGRLGIVNSGFPDDNPLFTHLAWVHTSAALLVALLVIALSGLISRLVGTGFRYGGKDTNPQPSARYLDMRILNTPTLAIEQGRKEISRMASVASFMFADIRKILFDFDARRADTIRKHEQVLDSLNHEITSFLAALARTTSNAEVSFEIPGMLQTVTDLEHMGDSCESVLNCIINRKEGNIFFSEEAMDDLRRVASAVNDNVQYTEDIIKQVIVHDDAEYRELKQAARSLFDEIKQHHFERISSGVCPPRAAMLFNEITAAFVRIAELSWNITTVQVRKQNP